MSLLNKIKDDMWAAKKTGEKTKANLLNTLYGEASKVGKDAGNRESTDAEVTATIKKFLKGIDEMLAVVKNTDAKATAVSEQMILNAYLPKQLTKEDIVHVLTEYRDNRLHEGATPTMGEYMSVLKDHYAGQYDGRVASEVAKSL